MIKFEELNARVPDHETDCGGCVLANLAYDAIDAVKVLEAERDVLHGWIKQLKSENERLESEVKDLEFSMRSLGY